MKSNYLAIAALFWSVSTYGTDIEIVKAPTAEGDIPIKFNKATREPLGEQDDRAQVIGANFSLEPTYDQDVKVHWSWSFVVKVLGKDPPVAIQVDDISKAPIVALVDDQRPAIKNGMWVGVGNQNPVYKPFLQQMLSNDVWFRVFKITIKYPDGKTRVLRQAAVYTRQTREQMVRTVFQTLDAIETKEKAKSK